MPVSNMTVSRLVKFEDKVAAMWDAGKIRRPVHLSGGNEEELLKIFSGIEKGDWIFCTHRNHYHALLAGIPEKNLLDMILNSPGGSMCVTSMTRRFYSSAIVCGLASSAVGVASAIQRDHKKNHVWLFLGDAATDEGSFYEAHRYAVGYDLPITFVIEDNNRSVTTPDCIRWGNTTAQKAFKDCSPMTDKIYYYSYVPARPHVGTGKIVSF